MMTSAQKALLLLALTGLGGCTLFPTRAPEILVDHDFGPLRAQTAQVSGPPVLLRVKSLGWLAGTTIHYRLLYQDPTAVHVYAQNRWIAPPTALLKARIRWHLGNAPRLQAGTGPIARLVVTLARFDQDFASPRQAFVRLTATAQLYDIGNGALIATTTLNLRQPCAPTVSGAVAGLARLGRVASARLAQFAKKRLAR